jgi:hypothetical protein
MDLLKPSEGQGTVSDIIRGLIQARHQPKPSWDEWEALGELCKAHPQANPGQVFRLALRTGIQTLKSHPEETKKRLLGQQ